MKRAFTLIELLIAIAIAAIITAALYFSINTSLESWEYSRDKLALQKVISEVIDEVVSGAAESYGLRDSLEITEAGEKEVEFVPPWTDDTHSAAARGFVYQLNRRVKPGTAAPICEVKLPEAAKFRFAPVVLVDTEDSNVSRAKVGLAVPIGSRLRFTYHPDAKTAPDVSKKIRYDPDAQQIYSEDAGGIKNISKNPFGVKITGLRFRYYDNTNTLIEGAGYVDRKDVNVISGVEVFVEAALGQYSQSLMSFVNLRNAPTRSGYLVLREGTEIPVPDSRGIHTLLVTNICGVSSNDELELEITPKAGKAWRVKVVFSRNAAAKPKIESYTIEYPAHHVVYTEYPRVSVDAGLNLLSLGSNGLYDYDDDEDIEDFVILDGRATLKVTKMDCEGAGLFVRP